MGRFMSGNVSYYNENAVQLAKQYDSLEFENVHRVWSMYWPYGDASVLDIGAGSGRDSRWFVEQGCSVVAVEPASELCQLGRLNSSTHVQWLDDALPALSIARELCSHYDLILLSAVWMHLNSAVRKESIAVLSELLSENGKLVITLRHGGFNDGRSAYSVSVEQLERLSEAVGLTVCHVAEDTDSLKRKEISWQTVVLEHARSNKSKGR
ncbi:Methyltransferase family protein [Vibrio crassostreae]|uniref:Methyltransferase type 12 domain-containing protein n=2 Tax=Vibrio crassostreae TaxID=246167 RepID=A0A822MP96_9VIBR|nr:methyltransferase family protein [Vibrio crassostreae]TCU10336.1 methyltransferase family protein [Vibrio crassostreae]CAK1971852.1 Methyltransferase family protein [Vibrio crassostreae]CAK2076360.1 Methyltransferase family protein [Vibrio crassostreae]CAK2130905.1 Methyltransferase family protein [Vibrio crassostreae]